ncbi:MAG: hypothetical protein IJN96_03980 [Clostridia bacterium]|nr:hypothetical protein [Clostridia bacterium]
MRIKMILLSLLSIVIVAISWLMNFGLVRLFCTLILIPFVHAVIVFAICAVASNYVIKKKIRVHNFLFQLTYILSNVFFPDADDLDSRMFFGLIENDFMCNLGIVISVILLIVHIVLLISQIIEINRTDKAEMFFEAINK